MIRCQLAQEQASEAGPVAVVYRALQDRLAVTAEQLKPGSAEIKKLHWLKDLLSLTGWSIRD